MEVLSQLENEFEKWFLEIINFEDKKNVILNLKNSFNILEKIYEEINEEKKNNDFNFYIINDNILNFLIKIKDNKSIKLEIKLEVNKIINKLLNIEYFPYIFPNNEKIPLLINTLFSIIQSIKGVLMYDILIRKMHLYLKYILNITSYKKIIIELKKGFEISLSYNYGVCRDKKDEIFELFSSNEADDKEKGIDTLIDYFNNLSFVEQYELISEYAGEIIVNLFKNLSNDYSNSYLKFGYVLINLLIPNKFIITSYSNNDSEDNKQNISYIYNDYFVDNLEDYFVLLPYKNYEFYFQKDITFLLDKILDVCITFISIMIKIDENFEIIYITYIILKRIYFIFPKCRNAIRDYIPFVLNKLCQTKDQNQWNIALGSRQFAYYLLVNDKELTTKIKSSTEISPIEVNIEPINLISTDLKFGFKSDIIIDQGKYIEKIIEILYDNSLIFIQFNLDSHLVGKDIDIKLLKFDTEKNSWNYIFEEKGTSDKSNKYIIYSRDSGLYKIIFDNISSWITKKKIFYQITLFKPIIEEKTNKNE